MFKSFSVISTKTSGQSIWLRNLFICSHSCVKSDSTKYWIRMIFKCKTSHREMSIRTNTLTTCSKRMSFASTRLSSNSSLSGSIPWVSDGHWQCTFQWCNSFPILQWDIFQLLVRVITYLSKIYLFICRFYLWYFFHNELSCQIITLAHSLVRYWIISIRVQMHSWYHMIVFRS